MKRLIDVLALAALIAATFTALAAAKGTTSKPAELKVAVAVTSKGFEPASIRVKAGQPVRLVITRKVERTCATHIVVKDYGIKMPLPLNQAVEVQFTPKKTGAIRYACAMDMIAGQLIVQEEGLRDDASI